MSAPGGRIDPKVDFLRQQGSSVTLSPLRLKLCFAAAGWKQEWTACSAIYSLMDLNSVLQQDSDVPLIFVTTYRNELIGTVLRDPRPGA